MFRTSVAAAALVLAAATPSFADGFGYDARQPYYGPQTSQYGDSSQLTVDYSGQYVFDKTDDHCAHSDKVVVQEYGYDKRYAPKYGYGYQKYGY
jgi:hypothetical protein